MRLKLPSPFLPNSPSLLPPCSLAHDAHVGRERGARMSNERVTMMPRRRTDATMPILQRRRIEGFRSLGED